MNFIIATPFYPPRVGGVEQMTAGYAAALARAGHRVTVLSPDEPPEGAGHPNLSFERVRRIDPDDLRLIPGTWKFVKALFRLLRREHVDWVGVFHPALAGGAALAARLLLGQPYFVIGYGLEILVPGPGLRHALRRWLQRGIYRRAALLPAISRYTQTRLVETGIPPGRVPIVTPGVDLAALEASREPARAAELRIEWGSRPVLVSVGRLVARKGVDTVLHALPEAIAARGDLLYVIVGDGPYRADLEAIVEELSLGDHVVFAGRVPSIAAYCEAADAFVMLPRIEEGTGDAEGFGIVYLEAAFHGLPIISSGSGGSPDACPQARFVDARLRADVAAAIVEILGGGPEIEKMVAEGRRLVERFSYDRLAEGLVEGLEGAGQRGPVPIYPRSDQG